MKEYIVYGNSLPEAYHNSLDCLEKNGEIVDCKAYQTRCKEVTMTISVENPLAEPMISRCGIFGPHELQQYLMEMLDGIMDFEVDAGKWKYTYHRRMVYHPLFENADQIRFVVEELKADPESRRAVICVRDNHDDMYSDDPACLQHIHFLIRNGKLDCKVLFRSNDAVKATFMNALALIFLQKRIADQLGIPVGSYSHRSNSFHCYERDWALLDGYCSRIRSGAELTFDYAGDWEEQMNDEIPEILEMVEDLKKHN